MGRLQTCTISGYGYLYTTHRLMLKVDWECGKKVLFMFSSNKVQNSPPEFDRELRVWEEKH